MTAASGLVTGGVLTKKGKMGFTPSGNLAPVLEIGEGERAAGFPCGYSSGPAGPLLPTELPFRSVDVKGSE